MGYNTTGDSEKHNIPNILLTQGRDLPLLHSTSTSSLVN